MNSLLHATKLGFLRSRIEIKQYLRSPQEITWVVVMSIIFLAVIWFQRETKIEGVSLALLTLPSILGMTIAQSGFTSSSSMLSYEREDGTLLRAKAIPQGMIGYLAARVIYVFVITIISLVAVLLPSYFLISGMPNIGVDGALALIGLVILGLLATAPWGAIIGSLVKSAGSGFGLTFLPFLVMTAISGIFYPITALAGWVQVVAQVFPLYWLGLGVRSVFLPDAAAAAEIGGSWRTEMTFAILAAWAIAGLLVAPTVLRRMARRQSGSEVEAGRQKAIQRGY